MRLKSVALMVKHFLAQSGLCPPDTSQCVVYLQIVKCIAVCV